MHPPSVIRRSYAKPGAGVFDVWRVTSEMDEGRISGLALIVSEIGGQGGDSGMIEVRF